MVKGDDRKGDPGYHNNSRGKNNMARRASQETLQYIRDKIGIPFPLLRYRMMMGFSEINLTVTHQEGDKLICRTFSMPDADLHKNT